MIFLTIIMIIIINNGNHYNIHDLVLFYYIFPLLLWIYSCWIGSKYDTDDVYVTSSKTWCDPFWEPTQTGLNVGSSIGLQCYESGAHWRSSSRKWKADRNTCTMWKHSVKSTEMSDYVCVRPSLRPSVHSSFRATVHSCKPVF